MKKLIAAGIVGLSRSPAGICRADQSRHDPCCPAAGQLGIDVRGGFMLALKNAGNTEIEVVTEDDGKANSPSDRRQDGPNEGRHSHGIIWSNLAMAVVPGVVQQDILYLSPNAGPSALAGAMCNKNYFNVAWQNDNLHEAMGAYANDAGYKKAYILAPNYPAGKDALTGFKRYFKGELAGETYTQLGQPDYAAEIAQIRASGADAIYVFLPGGMGIAFMKQYAQSDVGLPVLGPAFSFSQDILGAVGDAALGVKNSSQWSKDIDNAANKTFVESFQAEYGRLPSLYASQGYDAANLIIAAASKASVKDKEAFRAAIKEADFDSVRGDFSFGNNNHPIQDIYVREVVKEGDV